MEGKEKKKKPVPSIMELATGPVDILQSVI